MKDYFEKSAVFKQFVSENKDDDGESKKCKEINFELNSLGQEYKNLSHKYKKLQLEVVH
jgi:archaellum component FlaC